MQIKSKRKEIEGDGNVDIEKRLEGLRDWMEEKDGGRTIMEGDQCKNGGKRRMDSRGRSERRKKQSIKEQETKGERN